MYGMVNKAVEQMVCANHGDAVWESIKAKARVDVDVFISNESYDDDITYRLVGAASEILQTPADVILKAFGRYWVLETAQKGYGALMQSSGRTLPEFLINLNHMHTRVQMIFPNLTPPHFECHDVTPTSLKLHYKSHRPGLSPFVIGLVEGLGEMFKTAVQVEKIADRSPGVDHEVFLLKYPATG